MNNNVFTYRDLDSDEIPDLKKDYYHAAKSTKKNALTIAGFFTVGSNQVGVVETFRKFSRITNAGLNWCVPFFQNAILVDCSEQLAECDKMDVITSDKLNASVDLQIYYQVNRDEDSIKKALYAVSDYEGQTINLARTTLRNIVGKMKFVDVTSNRQKINQELEVELKPQLESWGLNLVRVEVKDIVAPKEMREAMNAVLVAEQRKLAAEDGALALEKEAEGRKKAAIQTAEGEAKATLTKAEADAKAIKLVQEQLGKSSEGYNKWYATHRWDGKLPNVTGSTVPFIDVSARAES